VDRKDIVTLEADMLDLDAVAALSSGPASAGERVAVDARPAKAAPMGELIEDCQRQAIRQALAAHQDNWAAAARQLALDPSNLHKLARRLGLKK